MKKFTEPLLRSLRSRGHFQGRWGQIVDFIYFYKFSFRIFVILGFEVIWPRQPHWPQKGLREFFQKLHFWNQCIPRKEMRNVSALSSKFSLNLSTEEVWRVSTFKLQLSYFIDFFLYFDFINFSYNSISEIKKKQLNPTFYIIIRPPE